MDQENDGKTRPDVQPRGSSCSLSPPGRVYRRADKCWADYQPNYRQDGRFDHRPDHRPDGRFDHRPDGRPDGRLDGRPDGRPDGNSEGRLGGRHDQRQDVRQDVRQDIRHDGRPDNRRDQHSSRRWSSRRDGRGSREDRDDYDNRGDTTEYGSRRRSPRRDRPRSRDDGDEFRSSAPKRRREQQFDVKANNRPVAAAAAAAAAAVDEVEDAQRDNLTVLIDNVSLKAAERDVWEFFSFNAGKVRDVQLIRDQRSGRSKGIGYIEFETAEAVLKSLSLSGQLLLGLPVRVQASHAERNRAAKAAKHQGPAWLFVGGLNYELGRLTAEDLKDLFAPFGSVVSVNLQRDPYTDNNCGFGLVQFRTAQEAREARAAMHGFEICGISIRVGFYVGATAPSSEGAQAVLPEPPGTQRDDGDDESMPRGGALTRMALTQKLQQRSSDKLTVPGGLCTDAGAGSHACVKLVGLVSQAEIDREGSQIVREIEEDVRIECEEKYGAVRRAFLARGGVGWVEFADAKSARDAQLGITGRIFGGQVVQAELTSQKELENALLQAL